MDFTHLQYFQALAKFEHMTHAAHSLHIAQPALSRALRKLETDMGLPLFDRNGKNISLNDNGRIFLRHTNTILQEMDEVRNILADRSNKSKKQVSVSMFAASSLLPDIVSGFMAEYPNISLIVTQQDVVNECDITIYSSSQRIEKKCCKMLIEEEICLAMPTSHPLSKCEELDLSQVANDLFVGLYKGTALRTLMDEYCLKAGFLPNIVLESDSPAMVRDLISLGVGLAFIPKKTWMGVEYGQNISLVDIKDPHCIRYIYMSWQENRYVSTASKLFQKYIVKFFNEV